MKKYFIQFMATKEYLKSFASFHQSCSKNQTAVSSLMLSKKNKFREQMGVDYILHITAVHSSIFYLSVTEFLVFKLLSREFIILVSRQKCINIKQLSMLKRRIFLYIQIARKITPRADDVVRSMYPPLDVCLLEARVAALILAVTHLALVSKHELFKNKSKLSWIDEALTEMNSHSLV